MTSRRVASNLGAFLVFALLWGAWPAFLRARATKEDEEEA